MDSNYFYCKCSICFENDSEMEFINCGDQYCLTCLERYVEYWLKEGSWGLLPIELTCPVCGSDMLDDDWMPYVSGKIISLWNKFQLKRKEILKRFEINRSCPICNHSQSLIGSDHKSINDLILITDSLITNLDKSCYFESWRTIFGLEHVVELFKIEKCLMDFSDFIESCQDLFDEFLNLIKKFEKEDLENDQDLIRLLMEFGRTFLSLFSSELEEEEIGGVAFIDMQLNFQSIFPFGHCDSCNLDFCIPCQYPSWFHQSHPNSSSSSSLNIRPDGSKQCPRCFVAIEKDPDGCNEMRCNYCGMKFCWECGRKWSKECGIYTCKQGNDEIPRSEMALKADTNINNSRDPEIGVPNVHLIHSNAK